MPILLLDECTITAATKEMNDAYRQGVRQHHLERATAYLKKQLSSLSNSVSKYSEIRFHLILFPVPDRARLIDQFSKEVAFHKA